ncbi:carbohydrate ABC transporter permease [Paenibacillus koleovorans]|uniref:carbohydrate ABC transporter permease n=1 Tax=Paenibacillus koleovorans TaxID=121608 RepID=UPI000FDB4963|nr:carbohydrate ABC transporter permease [Paenibacillus koleovorans]
MIRNWRISTIVTHLFFIVLCLLFTIPILTIVSISLSKESDILAFGYKIIPKSIDFSAYQFVFANPHQMIDSYKITIFVSIVGATTSVLIMLMLAYVLSRKIFKYRNFLAFIAFFTMLFNGGLIPKYILITQYLHLGNNIGILLLNDIVTVWYIFILRTFIQQIPEEILESAVMDGASEFRMFSSLILPLSKPAIATIGLFVLLRYWNDWTTPLIYISNPKLYPLQFMLQKVLLELQSILENMDNLPSSLADLNKIPSETVRMALAIIAAGPMLFVMPFFQKYFVRGLTIGSVKG